MEKRMRLKDLDRKFAIAPMMDRQGLFVVGNGLVGLWCSAWCRERLGIRSLPASMFQLNIGFDSVKRCGDT
jgi:hypothetical protein